MDSESNNFINTLTIIKVVLNHTLREIDMIKEQYTEIDEQDFIDYENNCIDMEYNAYTTYIITNKNYLPKLKKFLTNGNVDVTITDACREFFEKEDLEDVINYLTYPSYFTKKDKIIESIKLIFKENFTIDDVLDRINEKGINSLNIFHKYVLTS